VCCSIWAVDFFAFVNRMITFNAGLLEFASVAISADHFFHLTFGIALGLELSA